MRNRDFDPIIYSDEDLDNQAKANFRLGFKAGVLAAARRLRQASWDHVPPTVRYMAKEFEIDCQTDENLDTVIASAQAARDKS